MTSGSKYQGVILDIDGTLVTSNDAHARAWVQAFGDEGMDVPIEKVRPLIGMGGDQLVPSVDGTQKGTARYERLSAAWKKHFQEEMPNLKAQPGARELVQELMRRGLKLIVGTSADEAQVTDLLKIAGVEDLLPQRTTASDVEASKPRPDIVLAALAKLNLPPESVLMVGDTPYDVESARKAGVDTVALRCGGDDRFDGAVAVFQDPADMRAHLNEVFGQ